ncbi:hypothetical protein BLBBGE_091 [Blattabacterium sp. (Blattella germanica) str. Bge]|uniref:hypothetical protein n=1 Tax=Blattabacterium sp. (Blattella germanica) TaxID=624186 RepID=UPI0001BB60B1|nr:hypothetical protein [Blattabacterium sp. (Blattella germanica)]ACY40123.1 hypothetical protein BLBBGE_091 [Blattabacterium sp. (Blattella germanica) str. Bge]
MQRKRIFNKKEKKIPQRIFIKTSVFYKEDGLLRIFMYSPLIKEYTSYTLFPNGFCLFIYENDANKYTYLKADWVKSIGKIIYHIKGNIQIMNSNGYFVKTEEIFWNRKQKKIFNEKYTMIYNSNGTILHAINGIEASDDLKKLD